MGSARDPVLGEGLSAREALAVDGISLRDRRYATIPLCAGKQPIVVVVVATVLASASCTSDAQPEPATAPLSPGTTTASTSASPSPTKLPRLPLSEARLDGKYDVKVFVTSNSFDSKPAPRQAFKFIPKCDEGACDVTLLGAMAFTHGLADRQSAGAEKRFDIRLALLGRRYGGTKVDFWASCGDEPDKDRWTFAIKPDRARYVDDVWTVVRWSGTWSRSANFNGDCLPGHLRSVIRGIPAS
jgi:hypothetical protein